MDKKMFERIEDEAMRVEQLYANAKSIKKVKHRILKWSKMDGFNNLR